MAFTGSVSTVTTTPARLFTPTSTGNVLVQNLGAVVVWIGGPSVTIGQGLPLPVAPSLPVAVPVGKFGNVGDADDGLWAVAASTTSTVAVLASS